jgi:hypothetical protein
MMVHVRRADRIAANPALVAGSKPNECSVNPARALAPGLRPSSGAEKVCRREAWEASSGTNYPEISIVDDSALGFVRSSLSNEALQ